MMNFDLMKIERNCILYDISRCNLVEKDVVICGLDRTLITDVFEGIDCAPAVQSKSGEIPLALGEATILSVSSIIKLVFRSRST